MQLGLSHPIYRSKVERSRKRMALDVCIISIYLIWCRPFHMIQLSAAGWHQILGRNQQLHFWQIQFEIHRFQKPVETEVSSWNHINFEQLNLLDSQMNPQDNKANHFPHSIKFDSANCNNKLNWIIFELFEQNCLLLPLIYFPNFRQLPDWGHYFSSNHSPIHHPAMQQNTKKIEFININNFEIAD